MATFTDLTVAPVAPPVGGDDTTFKVIHLSQADWREFIPRTEMTAEAKAYGETTPLPEVEAAAGGVVGVVSKRAAATPATTRTGVAATDGKDKDVLPDRLAVGLTGLAVLVGIGVAWYYRQPSFTPTVAFNAFAVMYIIAQAIERISDPLTPFLGRAKPADEPKAKAIDQPTAKTRRDLAVVNALMKPGDLPAATKAAQTQRNVDQIRANLTLLMWGVNSMLAMLASGLLGLYLLKTVGMTNVPTLVDIAVTGLAIGAGTKPLHDLISNISASKTSKQDPSQTAKAG